MLRIATIGTSMITSDFIEVVNESADAVFVGTLSRNAERAASFTSERGGTLPFSDLGELAASDAVDAVYIGSPNALHAEQALACIAGGKHVMVEKPLGANEREAKAVLDAARDAGVVALEAMRPVHDPAFWAVRDALGELGRIRRADLRFGKYSSRYDEILAGRQTNIFDCRMASGALMDIGVYCVEALIALFGKPDAITCTPVLLDEDPRDLTAGALDGAGTIVARYPHMSATLSYAKITNDNLPCQIEGEEATLSFAGVSVPMQARIDYRGRALRGAAKEVRPAEGAHSRELELPGCANTMAYELADFAAAVEAVRAGADPLEAAAGPLGTVGYFREVTLTSIALMDEARRQAGIVFPADAR